MTPDNRTDSADYGPWPSIVGFTLAILIFTLMFTLATGFA